MRDDGVSNSDSAHGLTTLPTTSWSHVVGTFDGLKIRIYVNGELKEANTADVSLPDLSLSLDMGAMSSGSSYYGGGLDEVAIYSRALTQQEVTDHYVGGTS